MSSCCNEEKNKVGPEFETLTIQMTNNSCSICENYVLQNQGKSFAVVSCEGACLRGEISRRVANRICHDIMPAESVRICQGSALTKDGGQRQLVIKAPNLMILEGCSVQCASRLLGSFHTTSKPTIIFTDRYAEFDPELFGSNEVSEDALSQIVEKASTRITEKYFGT